MKKIYIFLLITTIFTFNIYGMKSLFKSLPSCPLRLTNDTIFDIDKPITRQLPEPKPPVKQQEEMPRCAQCAREFYIGEKIVKTLCAQEFHMACMDQMLQMNYVCSKCQENHDINSAKYTIIESHIKRSTRYKNMKATYFLTGCHTIKVFHINHFLKIKYQTIEADDKDIALVFFTDEHHLYIVYADKEIDFCDLRRRTRNKIFKRIYKSTFILSEEDETI